MKVNNCPKVFHIYVQTFDGGKNLLKSVLYLLKWNQIFFSNPRLEQFIQQFSLSYKFLYIPKLYSDSFGFYESILNKKYRKAFTQSGKVAKDSYSLYGLFCKCRGVKQASRTYLIGYGLLVTKAITSLFVLKRCYVNLNQASNQNKKNIYTLKIIKSVCWIATMIFTTYFMVWGGSFTVLYLTLSSVCLVSTILIDNLIIENKVNNNSNYCYY